MLEEKLKALENQYAEVEARLAAPETYDDTALVTRLIRVRFTMTDRPAR